MSKHNPFTALYESESETDTILNVPAIDYNQPSDKEESNDTDTSSNNGMSEKDKKLRLERKIFYLKRTLRQHIAIDDPDFDKDHEIIENINKTEKMLADMEQEIDTNILLAQDLHTEWLTKDGQHKLESPWSLWVHDKNEPGYSIDDYTNCITIDTVEQFLGVFSEPITLGCMYYLMRDTGSKMNTGIGPNGDGYRPIWDEIENIGGGAWRFRVKASDVPIVWLSFAKYMIGETLCSPKNMTNIIGMSLSPRDSNRKGSLSINENATIRIWSKDRAFRDISEFPTDINGIDFNRALYSYHEDGMNTWQNDRNFQPNRRRGRGRFHNKGYGRSSNADTDRWHFSSNK